MAKRPRSSLPFSYKKEDVQYTNIVCRPAAPPPFFLKKKKEGVFLSLLGCCRLWRSLFCRIPHTCGAKVTHSKNTITHICNGTLLGPRSPARPIPSKVRSFALRKAEKRFGKEK